MFHFLNLDYLREENSKNEVFYGLARYEEQRKFVQKLKSRFGRLSTEDCEDIVSDSLTVLWQNYVSQSDRVVNNMGSLLFTIASNQANKALRKHLKNEAHVDYIENLKGFDMNDADDDEMARWQLWELMGRAIDGLEPVDRKLLDLYMERIPVKQIREQLHFSSVQVVKNRKGKIITRLCKELSGQGNLSALFFFMCFSTRDEKNRFCLITFSTFWVLFIANPLKTIQHGKANEQEFFDDRNRGQVDHNAFRYHLQRGGRALQRLAEKGSRR